MELLADGRIELEPRPVPAVTPTLEVAFLGHCPPDRYAARWDRLGKDERVLEEIAALGFGDEVRKLREWATTKSPELESGDADLARFFRLPVPIHSLAQFQDLFTGSPYLASGDSRGAPPGDVRKREVFDEPTSYYSLLAGDRAWLPLAVQDFFETSGPLADGAKKLWIIRVPEADGPEAFLPGERPDLTAIQELGAFDRALLLPRVGVIALPDLERLHVPSGLPDLKPLRQPDRLPEFLPCSGELDQDHRDRAGSVNAASSDAHETLNLWPAACRIARVLARTRPDVQCLLAVPMDRVLRGELPQPSRAFLLSLENAVGSKPADGEPVPVEPAIAEPFRRLQWLYPYLRGPDRQLSSPCGLVAGMQAEISHRSGPWRSIAGRPMPGRSLPHPPVTDREARGWRDEPGLSILVVRHGRCELEDERLSVAALPQGDLALLRRERHRDEHLRSAEVMRFLGWLRRELQRLGEQLAFDVDPRDPRPGMLLRAFFDRLHRLGALRGRLPEQAYDLRQLIDGETTLVFEIDIAPSFPIDRIRLTFVHDRASDETRVEVAGG